MEKTFFKLIVLFSACMWLASCAKEPTGLADCETHRDSVANVLAQSDSTARFFGAWTVYNCACNLPPVLSGYQFTIEPDRENFPTGILINGFHPEYTEQLSGNRTGSAYIEIPLSSFINSEGDTLNLRAEASYVENGDTLFLSTNYEFQKGSNPTQVCIQDAYKLIQ